MNDNLKFKMDRNSNISSASMQTESVGNFMADHISENQYINDETEAQVQRLDNVISRFKKPQDLVGQVSADPAFAKVESLPDGVDCLNISNQRRRDFNKQLSYLLDKLESLI